MALWEFALTYGGGTVLGQAVLAEGFDEATAAISAAVRVAEHEGLVLSRPGKALAADVEARWREVYGDSAFPEIVPENTRMSRHARGP